MAEKYLMFSLDDPRMMAVADAINNKTCKKILEYLAEREATETDIARDLKIPANTINYDVKKLLNAGLIEKSNNFFWSVKGKKMLKYKVSNKKIVISPKSSTMKNLLISVLLTGVIAFFVKLYTSANFVVNKVSIPVLEKSVDVVTSTASEGVLREATDVGSVASLNAGQPIWLWFLVGGLTALVIYMILSWKRK